jgi:3,4-dihydroxy 2-butanone 4-phosphate synthase / GTP cyclohydrolase II
MVPTAENEESMYTAFTVTVDLREGITTGISASDRCKTIRALGDPQTTAALLRKPGHIFPLMAREGGVLARPGHTEAALDLARLAGCSPAGVLCEVVDKATGEMARTGQLLEMAKQHGLKCITIEDLIRYRLEHESGA